MAGVVWDGDSLWTASQLLNASVESASVRSAFTAGPRPSKALQREAAHGHAERTLARARRAESILIRKQPGRNGRWTWELPPSSALSAIRNAASRAHRVACKVEQCPWHDGLARRRSFLDAQRFDSVVRRLAQSQLSRRMMIGSGAFGLGALVAESSLPRRGTAAAAPARQGTPAATPAAEHPDAISIDGAWFCNQTYVLCNTALCERSADDPGSAKCHCVVLNGYSIGFKTCSERAQVGTSLWSTFSTANVNSEFGILTCPDDAAWANCLDYPCEMDPRDPALATCQCTVVESGPFRTFGGRCDERACTAELLSGTSLDVPGVQQYIAGMQQVRQTITLPATCAEATPAAG